MVEPSNERKKILDKKNKIIYESRLSINVICLVRSIPLGRFRDFFQQENSSSGFVTLFMVELWERFSYYGMRALLILYMTANLIDGGFDFSDGKAYGIYGAYGALVYLTPLIGGYFADKLMGFRKAITLGAILMAMGQFTLFMNNQTTFFIGLALLVVGNGFF